MSEPATFIADAPATFEPDAAPTVPKSFQPDTPSVTPHDMSVATRPAWLSRPVYDPQPSPEDLAFRKEHPWIGAVEGAAVGVAKTLTTPEVAGQALLTQTVAAPVVYTKWAYDMIRSGVQSVKDLTDRMTGLIGAHISAKIASANQLGQTPPPAPDKEQIQGIANDAVNAALMFVGVAGMAGHALAPKTTEAVASQLKETPNAVQPETTPTVRPLRDQPKQSPREMPAKASGTPSDEGGGKTPQPQEKVVSAAIQTPQGNVVAAPTHVEAYDKAKSEVQPDTSGSKEGFVTDAGTFVSREQAANMTGLPTETEPGKLHSSDLNKSQSKPVDWDAFSEKLYDDLSSWEDSRTPGKQTWGLRDAADRFIEFAKSDTSGKSILELFKQFKATDSASKSQLNKLGKSIQSANEPPPSFASRVPSMSDLDLANRSAGMMQFVQMKRDAGEPVISEVMDNIIAVYKEARKRNLTPANETLESIIENKESAPSMPTPPQSPVPPSGVSLEPGEPSTTPGSVTQDVTQEGKAQPEIVGMGGAKAGEPPSGGKAELAQLTDSIRTLATQAPNESKGVQAFDLGKAMSKVKDGVTEFTTGLKAVGQYLKVKLEGMPKIDDYTSALGQRHLELSESVANAKEFVASAEKAVPNKTTQEAISNYIDTGGKEDLLRQGLAETKAPYKAGYEKAMDLTPEEQSIAENTKNYFESRLDDAIEAGILEDGIEDYIHRIYETESPWKNGVLAELRSGVFAGKPRLAKQRVFQYDFEAEKAGLKPIKSFTKRVAAYDLSLNKAIADRKLIKSMMSITMPDGRPMIDVGGIGIEVPKGEAPKEATLIKPSFKPFDETPENNRGDYKAYDHPSLRKWKWVAKDAEGKPIFVQGDVLVHPEAIGKVKALFEKSKVRENPVGRAALAIGSTVKQTMLDLSGFHPTQITVHGWEHRTFKPVEKIDFTDPDVRGLIKGGMVVGDIKGYELFSEGLTGSSLTRYIPGLGPKLQAYQEWLFNSYIPRLKTATGLHALERNRARFPELSQEQIYRLTGEQMNAAFGEQNYAMMGRSQTTQDLLRIALLAPDFLEARGRFVAQALTKFGREQMVALGLGAVTLYVTARIINKLLSGEYHFEPKNAFSVVYNKKAYSLRTVQGDVLHAAMQPGQFVYTRLNPVFGRTGMEFATGRDYFGRKRSGLEQLKDLGTTIVPISMRGVLNPREQNLWESFLNAFGITERRSTPVETISQLADNFKKAHKIRSEPGEFIYDAEKDPFRGIKQASTFSSPETVSTEIERAVKKGDVTTEQIKKHFESYASRPFTGSKKNDQLFYSELSEDNKKIYNDAIQLRREVKTKFEAGYKLYLDKLKASRNVPSD